MRDQLGNYQPEHQRFGDEGFMKTGFLSISDNTATNIISNILVSGGLSMYATSSGAGRSEAMVNNLYGEGPRAGKTRWLKGLKESRRGGISTFLMADNLAGQNLERKLFSQAGLFKQRTLFNPIAHFQSMGAKFFAGVNAKSGGFSKEMEYLKAVDSAAWKSATKHIKKRGETDIVKKIVGRQASIHALKGGLSLGLNVAARALAFQEIMLPGQILGVFGPSSLGLGGQDFGGIFRALGHAEEKKRRSGLTIATMSHGFHDNKGAATMRQRSIAAIHNTQSSLNQVFGQEAIYAHR